MLTSGNSKRTVNTNAHYKQKEVNMADFPQNNTLRVKQKYFSFDGTHTMLFRFPSGFSVPTAVSQISNFFTEMAPLYNTDTTFTDISYSNAGTDFFLPSGSLGIQGENLDPRNAVQPKGYFWNLTGISGSGNQASWYFFGVPYLSDRESRLLASENASVASLVTNFNAFLPDLCAIDNINVIIREYVNIKVNDYLVHKARQ